MELQVEHARIVASLKNQIAEAAGTIALLEGALGQRTAELEAAHVELAQLRANTPTH